MHIADEFLNVYWCNALQYSYSIIISFNGKCMRYIHLLKMNVRVVKVFYCMKIIKIIQFYIPAYGQLHTRSNMLLHRRKLKACGQGRHPSNRICNQAPSFYFRIGKICYYHLMQNLRRQRKSQVLCN